MGASPEYDSFAFPSVGGSRNWLSHHATSAESRPALTPSAAAMPAGCRDLWPAAPLCHFLGCRDGVAHVLLVAGRGSHEFKHPKRQARSRSAGPRALYFAPSSRSRPSSCESEVTRRSARCNGRGRLRGMSAPPTLPPVVLGVTDEYSGGTDILKAKGLKKAYLHFKSQPTVPLGRGLHSSTSQLNLSRVWHKKTPCTPLDTP
jgi:hypothetical protein